eukprot:230476_1
MLSFNYEPEFEFRYIGKRVLVGMVLASIIGFISVIILLITFLQKSKKIDDFDIGMKWNTIFHFIGNIIFCFGAAFFRCDLIFPIKYNLSNTLYPKHKICKITISIPFIGYYTSKIFLYLLFIRRVEFTFDGSIYAVNKTFVRIFQCIVITTLIASMIMFISSESYQYCQTIDDKIHICSSYTEHPLQNAGGLSIIIICVFDLLYSTLTLFLFIYKLNKLIQSQLKFSEHDIGDKYVSFDHFEHNNFEGKQRLQELVKISLKCCVLCFVTVISNWIFIFVGATFVFEVGWFICMDCLINAICVYLLYKFNNPMYNIICFPVIVCWQWIAQCLGFTEEKLYQTSMNKHYNRLQLIESKN